MITFKMLELKGQIPEVKWNALWEDYRKFVEKKNKKINQLETNIAEAYKLLDSIDEYMLVEQHLKLVEAKKLLERGKE